MNTFRNYFTNDTINWLEKNGLKYKEVDIVLDKGDLSILFNDNFCLKIYDRLGHGFGVTINVAEVYSESIYDNDSFDLGWAYKYFDIEETASFKGRQESQYLQNLPNLINDLKKIIPKLSQLDSNEWNKMKEWINKEALKYFS